VMIERVVLTGPGSMLPGIVGAFEDRLGLPALSWDPFEQIQISDPTVRETVRQRGPAFVLALGLAVGGYDQG